MNALRNRERPGRFSISSEPDAVLRFTQLFDVSHGRDFVLDFWSHVERFARQRSRERRRQLSAMSHCCRENERCVRLFRLRARDHCGR
jgi:hypothetical protein